MDDFQHLDDYALLGVSPGAQPEDIKQAYRREIAKYHPDRYRHADPQMQQYAQQRSQRITEAYAALNRNPRARSQPRRVQPTTSAEQLAADYQRAQTLLAAGSAAEAARLLRQIQRVDPFYRDVDDLLARAESLSGGTAERSASRRPAAWLTGAAIAALLLGGGIYGWNSLRSSDLAEQPPTGTAGVIVGANPTGAIAETVTATPLVVADVPTTGASSAPAASEPAGGTLPTAETVPTTPPPPTEIPPSPTSEPPSPTTPPTDVPPPTEVPPPPTEVPPTPVPPTAVPPTAAPPRPTQVPPRPTQAPAPPAPPVGGLEGGQVLDGDNFSNPASGWPSLQEATYTLGYRDGAYVITSQPNTGAIFAYGSPLGPSNAIIGADVIPVRGAAGLNFGPDNSYRFLISADGRFRVEQRGGRVIVRPTASNAIRAGRNRLVLAVVGTRASVYANGTLLANFNVPTPLAGTTYGFVVVPGPNGGEGIFDSLTVRTLPR